LSTLLPSGGAGVQAGHNFNAGRNFTVVQERDVDRNLEKLNEYCRHHKESGILADIEKIGH
jgi:hypothetical protein